MVRLEKMMRSRRTEMVVITPGIFGRCGFRKIEVGRREVVG